MSRYSGIPFVKAGINPYYFEFANIREHCSWVHSREKEEATQKAKDIIRMSVARTALLDLLMEFELPVDKRALVVGGGVAGMTSALSLANQGFDVYLLEKEAELGGMARKLHYTLEGLDVQNYLDETVINRVYKHPYIHVYTDATISDATGYVGNFVTKIDHSGQTGKNYKHGITIIATGAEEYKPTEYLYGKDDRVLTLVELEEKIAKRRPRGHQCPERGDDPVRRLPADGPELLQPGMLRPFGKGSPETKRKEPGHGYLYPVPGYADLRLQRRLLPGGRGQGSEIHPLHAGR